LVRIDVALELFAKKWNNLF